jgi:ubiquinone/menaquinone biosynthesis C-methylase UbiE
MSTSSTLAPNHHARDGGFHGLAGVAAALSMVVGREADARVAIELTDLHAGDRLVDVGCGPGVALRRAARLGATVTGIDPAPVMRRVASLLSRRVEIVDGVAERLPLPDGSATVLWSIATVHHWRDLDAGMTEARRVLAPGGRFLAMERRTSAGAHGLASHGWTDEQAEAFAALVAAAGFAPPTVVRRAAGRRPLVAVTATRGD